MFQKCAIYCSFLIAFALLNTASLFAQNETLGRQTFLQKQVNIPNTPEAASLGKYGDVQVNYYTGAINLGIPVYTIKGRDISLPVALQYDGSGNKVDNLPTWVGLGWTLAAGGVITRGVQGNPDMQSNYYGKAAEISPNTNTPHANLFTEHDYLYQMAIGNVETQPDGYYFNFGNYSGLFRIDPNKFIYLKEVKDLGIQVSWATNGDITAFNIKDEYGNLYEFTAAEQTFQLLDDDYDVIPLANRQYTYNSAWYLTKITSANLTETIELSYETLTTPFTPPINPWQYESMTYGSGSLLAPGGCSPIDVCGSQSGGQLHSAGINSVQINNRRVLSQVTYKISSVEIEKVAFVSSLSTAPFANGGKKLDFIRVNRRPSASTNLLEYQFTYDNSTNRLTLKTFKEVQPGTSINKEPYQFAYNATQLPAPTSSSIDHWGYYNSNSNSGSLIPSHIAGCGGTFYEGGGANRNPNESRMKAGILTRITYPTGGYTDFTFEPHKVKGTNTCPGGNPDVIAGGLRIKEIKNYTATGQLAGTRTLQYIKEGFNPTADNASSGLLHFQPLYFSISTNIHYALPAYGVCNPVGYDYSCGRTTLFSVPRSALGGTPGNHVGYSRVEEIFAGKTVYHYRNDSPSGGDEELKDNGDMLKKQEYDDQGKILMETTYKYSADTTDNRRNNSFWSYRVEPKPVQDNKLRLCYINGVYTWDFPVSNCLPGKIYKLKFQRRYTRIRQTWKYLYQTDETSYFYDSNGLAAGSVKKVVKHTYGNTNVSLPTSTSTWNSDGRENKQVTRYAHDAANALLIGKRMIALPLEEENYVGTTLVYRTKLSYSTFGGRALPHQYFEKFNSSQSDVLKESVQSYDIYGNLTQAKREHDQPMSLLWGHYGMVMTARVQNAENNETAYTSFETAEATQGNWNISNTGVIFYNNGLIGASRTGYGYYNGSANASKTGLPAGKYWVSYHTKNAANVSVSGGTILTTTTHPADAQGWIYVERLVQCAGGSSTITVTITSTQLDELRLHPEDALMTTYAYDRENRLLTSIADENSIPASFQYDGLLRLQGIRDLNSHFVQTYEYLYKNVSNPDNVVRARTVLTANQTLTTQVSALTGANVKRVFQYFDGLGRPVQSAGVAQSPTSKDVVSPQAYDSFGRENKKYLPYTATTNGGLFRSAAFTEQTAFYSGLDGGYGYSEQILETSPLSRVKETLPPGSEYRLHPTRMSYGTNTSATEVRNFRDGGYYPANSLYKMTDTDENGNTTISYKDRLGRTKMTNQAGAKTYYVHDDFGDLWAVLPPEASVALESSTTWTINSATSQERIYKYTYDANTRLLSQKKVPGANAQLFYYDRLDRPVMSTDGNGFKSFTKYDILGRPVLSGKYKGAAVPTAVMGLYETRNTTAPHYYTSTSAFPTDGNFDVYAVTYYDHYDVDGNGSLSVAENFVTPPSPYLAPVLRVRGKATVSKTAVLPSDGTAPTQYLFSRTYSDLKGRVVQEKTDNHLSGQDIYFSLYNFPGWATQTRRQHTATPPGGSLKTINLNRRFTYDHAGRLLKTEQQIDGEAAWTTLSEQVYDERDLLQQKKLHKTSGGAFLQTLDYTYNIRGWLETINPFDNAADLFAMKLYYKNGDPQLHTDYTGGANSNWNGNITMLEWQVNNTAHRMYGFFYDGRNQLKRGESGTRTNNAASPVLNTNYKTDYTYDNAGLSSNLKTVTRRGLLSGTSTFGIIDQMTYTYNTAGQLTQIGDTGSSTKGFKTPGLGSFTYTYDLNGNMSRDNHKNMTVAYNHLNLPRQVLFDNFNEIYLTYTAAGEKITKFTAANTGAETTQNYVSGIEYNGAAVEAVYHEEGRLVPNGTAWHYEYTLKDHLGNSRVMFRANGSTAQLLQENHYYPFGMEMEGTWTAQVGVENKYQYNGKELVEDFGWNWSDYGARGYDASVGRWWSVDPMAEAYHSLSVYHYGLNNPIANVDLFGMMSSNPNEVYKERAEKREARRKETDEDAEGRESAKSNINAYMVNEAGLDGNVLGNALTQARNIFSRNDINIESLSFVMKTKEEAQKMKLAWNDLFLAVVDWWHQPTEGGFSASTSGVTSTYNNEGTAESFVNTSYFEIDDRKGASFEYGLGYLIAHELLHQMLHNARKHYHRDGVTFFSRKEHYNGSPNLNMHGDFMWKNHGGIPKLPPRTTTGLHAKERILLKPHRYLVNLFLISK